MTTQTQQQETQINPLSYLRIFFRRKYFLIVPAVIGLGISFLVANTLPKIYQSYTNILIEEERRSNPALSGLAVFRSAHERARYLRDQILSWDRLVKLSEKLNLVADVKNQKELETLIFQDLRKNIDVGMRGASLVRIGFQGEDPERAQLIVKTITDIFIEENIAFQERESDVAIEFLEDQLKVYHKKIKESEIAGMEEQLNRLLLDSTDEHPMVKDLKVKIANSKEDVLKNTDTVVENPEFIKDPVYERLMQGLEREISTIEPLNIIGEETSPVDSSSTGDEIYKVALMTNISKSLSRDTSMNEKIYNMLLQKLETARISKRLAASKEGTRYTILDPPRVPDKPVKPNKPLVMLIGVLIGAGLGFGVIVLFEVLDRSFLGVDEAKALLDLPILGAISKIMTAADLAREKAKRSAQVWTWVLASVAFVNIVIVYTIITKP
ncbi:MAG: hypothetical protein KJ952_05555 [Candidatus Omnitrophica bacterium]|nr:hypothetical protein [Candidatus Omnitrophota bacterium]